MAIIKEIVAGSLPCIALLLLGLGVLYLFQDALSDQGKARNNDPIKKVEDAEGAEEAK